jgi:hypothetical protein
LIATVDYDLGKDLEDCMLTTDKRTEFARVFQEFVHSYLPAEERRGH